MSELPIISCDGCGACCSEMGVPPFVRHEIYDLPEKLRDQVLNMERLEPDRESSGLPCYWYNPTTKKCSNYEHRPLVCEDFEVGCDPCLRWRKHGGII